MNTYPQKRIDARIGEQFEITVPEAGSTGFLYEPNFDDRLLSLVTVQRRSSQGIGASGVATFVFDARASGTTEIELLLRAPWEPEPAGRKVFQVFIAA